MGTSTLLTRAFGLHYSKLLPEACLAYRELLAATPSAEEEAVARQQLGNLRDFDTGRHRDLAPNKGSTSPARAESELDPMQLQNRGDLQGGEGRR